jgi:hypothetical protein
MTESGTEESAARAGDGKGRKVSSREGITIRSTVDTVRLQQQR